MRDLGRHGFEKRPIGHIGPGGHWEVTVVRETHHLICITMMIKMMITMIKMIMMIMMIKMMIKMLTVTIMMGR